MSEKIQGTTTSDTERINQIRIDVSAKRIVKQPIDSTVNGVSRRPAASPDAWNIQQQENVKF